MAMGLSQDDRQWILDALEANMSRLKRETREESREDLRDMETRLLTAFHTWASPMNVK